MRSRVLLAAIAALLVPTAPAQALGVAITSPAGALTPFKTGSTATATGIVTVTDTGVLTPWTMTVADANGGTTAGHMTRAGGCTQGVASLTQPLRVTATPAAGTGTSTGTKTLGPSEVQVAGGPVGVSVVTVAYQQDIGASELVVAGCTYTISVVYTVS